MDRMFKIWSGRKRPRPRTQRWSPRWSGFSPEPRRLVQKRQPPPQLLRLIRPLRPRGRKVEEFPELLRRSEGRTVHNETGQIGADELEHLERQRFVIIGLDGTAVRDEVPPQRQMLADDPMLGVLLKDV